MALRRISRSTRSSAFSRSSTRMRSASESPSVGIRVLLDAVIGLGTFSPLVLVLVPVPKASSQVHRQLRLTPRSVAMALSIAPGLTRITRLPSRLNCSVCLAWHGGKVPHFPSEMLVSACPPPGDQVRPWRQCDYLLSLQATTPLDFFSTPRGGSSGCVNFFNHASHESSTFSTRPPRRAPRAGESSFSPSKLPKTGPTTLFNHPTNMHPPLNAYGQRQPL